LSLHFSFSTHFSLCLGAEQFIKEYFMEVRINSCLEGAREARGLTVIIDVFRSSNTILTCLDRGADYIIPVGPLDEAYRLKEANPDHLLVGERKSQTPEGFDLGNSPVEISQLDMRHKKAILTTSAGTQGIVSARLAQEIVVGSFANAQALVAYIGKQNPDVVTLAPMGFASSDKAEEDEQCALYLKQQLLGQETDMEQMRRKILDSKGADRLRRIGREDDMEFGLRLDLYNMIPRYDAQTQRIQSLFIT